MRLVSTAAGVFLVAGCLVSILPAASAEPVSPRAIPSRIEEHMAEWDTCDKLSATILIAGAGQVLYCQGCGIVVLLDNQKSKVSRVGTYSQAGDGKKTQLNVIDPHKALVLESHP